MANTLGVENKSEQVQKGVALFKQRVEEGKPMSDDDRVELVFSMQSGDLSKEEIRLRLRTARRIK